MKLILKFAVLMLIPLAGLAFTFYEANQALNDLALFHVKKQAELLMDVANAARSYTTGHVLPLLNKSPESEESTKGSAPVSANNPVARKFIQESVPAFAARQMILMVKQNSDYEEYFYKEAVVRPTIEEDKADRDEMEWISEFRQGTRHEEYRSQTHPDSYVFPKPMSMKPDCIICHSTKEAMLRPEFIKKHGDMFAAYKTGDQIGGLDWPEEGVVAVQVVYVPKRAAAEIAAKATNSILIAIVIAGVLTIAALWVAVVILVIRPVARLSQMAEQISLGRLSSAQLPVNGTDEIAQLTAAFNRMNLSLYKIVKRNKST